MDEKSFIILAPGPRITKLFLFVNKQAKSARVFPAGKLFQHSLIFASVAELSTQMAPKPYTCKHSSLFSLFIYE
jgi:hypothetical protein